MFRRAAFLVCWLMVLATVPAAGRQTTLEDPDPIVVPAARSETDIDRAVTFALATKGWAVQKRVADEIVATYSPNTHVAEITVAIGNGRIVIGYRSSVNLNFEQDGGAREIHPAYNTWVQALHDEIARNLADGVPVDAVLPVVTGKTNPRPVEKFSNFGRFTMVAAELAPTYTGNTTAEDALRNVRHALDLELAPLLDTWTRAVTPDARELRIEPVVDEIRFIGTATRIFAGMLAGRSSVTVRVRYVDVTTGATIAEPRFHLTARGNGWSASTRDYGMLERAGASVAAYTRANYTEAVGGTTEPVVSP